MKCKKCKATLKQGIALQNRLGGVPDFVDGEVMTVSPNGKADLIKCLKCPLCGKSYYKGGKTE
jgi:hypothetical protein